MAFCGVVPRHPPGRKGKHAGREMRIGLASGIVNIEINNQ